MTNRKKSTPTMTAEQQRVMENLWLSYFNDTLFAKGVITESERNRMRVKIKARRAVREC
jgi:hypothetical protein